MSSVSMTEMRKFVMNFYGGMKWRQKVLNMPDNQIIALYHSFKNRDKIANPATVAENKKEEYHQIDMFEYMLTGSKEEIEKENTSISRQKVLDAMAKAEADYANLLPGYFHKDNAMVFSLRYVKELLGSLLEDETDAK